MPIILFPNDFGYRNSKGKWFGTIRKLVRFRLAKAANGVPKI